MDFVKLKKEYERFDLSNDNVREELRLIETLSSEVYSGADENWNSLSENEKRIQRIFYSKSAKNTEAYKVGFYRYEESIIDLYESICVILERLDKSGKENDFIQRLVIFLELTKHNLNLNRDTRMIKSLHFSIAKKIMLDCLGSDLEEFFIYDINLLYLESKFYISNHLWETERRNFC